MFYPTGETMSRLDWQEQPSYYAQIDGNIILYGICISGLFLTSLPVTSGIMEDYDWLYSQDLTKNTHYSSHDMRINKRFILEGQIGYTFNFGTAELTPLGGLRYIRQKWTGSNGNAKYHIGNLTGEETSYSFSGDVISYEQIIYLPIAGAAFQISLQHCLLDIYIHWYPYVYVDSLDLHLLRNSQFYDEMRGGQGVAVGIGISYQFPHNRCRISNLGITLRYEYYESKNGKSYSGAIGSTVSYTNDSTPGTTSTQFSLGVRLSFK